MSCYLRKAEPPLLYAGKDGFLYVIHFLLTYPGLASNILIFRTCIEVQQKSIINDT